MRSKKERVRNDSVTFHLGYLCPMSLITTFPSNFSIYEKSNETFLKVNCTNLSTKKFASFSIEFQKILRERTFERIHLSDLPNSERQWPVLLTQVIFYNVKTLYIEGDVEPEHFNVLAKSNLISKLKTLILGVIDIKPKLFEALVACLKIGKIENLDLGQCKLPPNIKFEHLKIHLLMISSKMF